MGIHTAEEVAQFGCDDLKALSDLLADKPFFFGDEPTTVSIVILFLEEISRLEFWEMEIFSKFLKGTK